MNKMSIKDINDEKNFRQKKRREKNSVVFDFNIYKLTQMIENLEDEFYYHPDTDALGMILEMYQSGTVNISWIEGWPMPDVGMEFDGFDGFDEWE